jgi:hypothetical protein
MGDDDTSSSRDPAAAAELDGRSKEIGLYLGDLQGERERERDSVWISRQNKKGSSDTYVYWGNII